jgi:hypothetical protein
MSYLSYSPWQDAANVGRGIGDSLSQAILMRPELRARVVAQQQQQQEQQQRFPLEQKLLEAQIGNTQAQPELRRLMDTIRMMQVQQQGEHYTNMDAARDTANDNTGRRLDILEQAQHDKEVAPPKEASPWAVLASKLGLMGQRERELAPAAGVTKDTPIVPDMALKDQVMQGKTPEDVQALLSLAQLVPNLMTNKPAEQHWYGDKPAQVATNSFTMKLPPEAQAQIGASLGQPQQQPTALLPIEQRIVGKTYQLPKGSFVWTGAGWIPAQTNSSAQ